jgi:hypothetical protein
VQGAYSGSYSKGGAAAVTSEKQRAAMEKEYADVLTAVKAFSDDHGRRPRMLVAKMGQDGHDRYYACTCVYVRAE